VKAQTRWKIKAGKVGSGSQPSQTITHLTVLLSLLSFVWHYKQYFEFTHSNSTHPTLNCRDMFVIEISVATLSAINTEEQQLFPQGSCIHLL